MREERFKEALAQVGERQLNGAVEILVGILEENQTDDTHFKALKLYADILGPISGRDFARAIDIYQEIVNTTEDDDLYESAQVSMMSAYLSQSIHMMETYENTRDILESDNQNTLDLLTKLDQKREQFLTHRAEAIYKGRM